MGHRSFSLVQKGFTIVELLVVVVVIAILASITIVSYNGISKSSYNSQILSGVRTYYEAIMAYQATMNAYPKTQPEIDGQHLAMTCLGVGYKDQQCGKVTNVTIYEDATFNTQLKSFLGSTGTPVSNANLPVPGETYIGAVYGIDSSSFSSTGYARVIEYALYGQNADCRISNAHAYSASSTTTACEVILEEISF